MSNTPERVSIYALIVSTFKTVIASDQPEAEQLAADLNRAFVRAQRLIKKEVLAKGKVNDGKAKR